MFPDEVPAGLPPIHGIEHQIDLVLGASLPNRPAYRSNPEETKEIQRQVKESFWTKGMFVNPYRHVLFRFFWSQRKMGLGACVLIVMLSML